MLEEWLPIEEFDDYVVSNYGVVKNALTDRYMALTLVQYGMPTVAMMKDGTQYRRSLAGIVARAFLDAPPREDFNTPIHLDGDRRNCRVDNLEWRPRWFAINYHLECRKGPVYPKWSRDFRLNETGEVFDNPSQVARKYGLLEREIHKSLVNQTPCFPKGFTFTYLDF